MQFFLQKLEKSSALWIDFLQVELQCLVAVTLIVGLMYFCSLCMLSALFNPPGKLIFKILDQYKFLGFCLKEEHWSIFFMKLRNLSNVYWLQSSPFSVLPSSYNLRRICVELCRVWSSSLIFSTSSGFWKRFVSTLGLKMNF